MLKCYQYCYVLPRCVTVGIVEYKKYGHFSVRISNRTVTYPTVHTMHRY